MKGNLLVGLLQSIALPNRLRTHAYLHKETCRHAKPVAIAYKGGRGAPPLELARTPAHLGFQEGGLVLHRLGLLVHRRHAGALPYRRARGRRVQREERSVRTRAGRRP